MKHFFYLSTCDTCKRIMKQLPLEGVELQDIKTEPMTAAQVDEMIARAGSAEALFSKRARKYKELGLKDQQLSEAQLRQFIIDEYTFLKRPVLILDQQIFIGNTAKVIEAAREALLAL
ncbi:MAG: Regulatory protein Spx [Cryomorphaceae bacterium]|nr:MAG: Regulatory protein Spx [Cryomorphaceae bacterium]